MKRWAFFDPESELTPIARLIMAEDIPGLDAMLGHEWKLNQPFFFTGGYCNDLAISLAIVENKHRVIDYLIVKGANLNVKGMPAITFAARNSDIATLQKLLDAGARIDAVNNVGSNAYSCALHSNRFDLLPFLLAKGLKVDADGGVAFRQAVSDQQRGAVEFFLASGMDPDLRQPSQVYPYNPTAVQVAAEHNDFDMVRLLVDHGADVTLQDDNGNRPFLAAVSNKNGPMQSYLRALEPAAWHSPESKIAFLQDCGVTQDLIEFLQRADRRIYVNTSDCTWLDFHELLNVHEMRWPGGPYLALLAEVDKSCACGALAWSKRKRRLVIIDQEYDKIIPLGSWSEFVAEPGAHLAKQWA
jgi:ankyrin repeat protein